MTTWIPVVQPAETWSEQARTVRMFDPYVFDRSPTFDTGASASGIWDAVGGQSEIWTQA